MIEIELNSVNDNLLIDVDGECILYGGYFYGGYIVLVMDILKNIVVNVVDLFDW